MSAALGRTATGARRSGARTRLRAHLELGRVSNLPTVWTNVLAATVLCGGAWTGPGLAFATAAFSCLYVAGMYFNDACDAATDARERPGRPIPSGRVSLGEARAGAAAWCAAGFALGGASRALAPDMTGSQDPSWLVAFAALAGCIALYDLTHEATPLSPVLMALCRVLVFAGAALLVAPVPGPAVALLAALGFAWITGLTRLARDEAAALGRPADTGPGAAGAATWWPYAALGLAPAIAFAAAMSAPVAAALGAALVAAILRARRAMRSGVPGAFPAAVGSLVAAVALVDAVALARADHAGMAALAVGGFVLALAAQRHVAGS